MYTLEGSVLSQSSRNLVRMLILIKSRSRSKLGHVGSKTRSLGQVIENPCLHSRRHSFDPFMKLHPLSDKCETGSHWKNIGHWGIS